MTINPTDVIPVTEWDKMIEAIIRKHAGRSKPEHSVSRDDLKQEAWIGLLKASERFDPEKAKFTTFAYRYIEGYILKYLTKNIKYIPVSGEEENVFGDQDAYVDESIENNDFMNRISEILHDQPHVHLLHEHYVLGKSFREMSLTSEVSHVTIANRVNAMLKILSMRLSCENS